MVRKTFWIERSADARFRERAYELECSEAALVRAAIRRFFAQEDDR